MRLQRGKLFRLLSPNYVQEFGLRTVWSSIWPCTGSSILPYSWPRMVYSRITLLDNGHTAAQKGTCFQRFEPGILRGRQLWNIQCRAMPHLQLWNSGKICKNLSERDIWIPCSFPLLIFFAAPHLIPQKSVVWRGKCSSREYTAVQYWTIALIIFRVKTCYWKTNALKGWTRFFPVFWAGPALQHPR